MDNVEQVLEILGNRELTGREIHTELNRNRWWFSRWSKYGFNRLMSSLEECDLIEWRDVTQHSPSPYRVSNQVPAAPYRIQPTTIRYYKVKS